MRTQDIVSIYIGLKDIKEKNLPVRVAYAINLNIRKMTPIVEAFDEARMDLIKKYAAKDGNGGYVTDKDGNIKIHDAGEFRKVIDEAMKEDVSLDFKQIELSALDACDDSHFDALSAKDLEKLTFMIKEDE